MYQPGHGLSLEVRRPRGKEVLTGQPVRDQSARYTGLLVEPH